MNYYCQKCEESFLPRRSDAIYCSHRCRQAAYVFRKQEREAVSITERGNNIGATDGVKIIDGKDDVLLEMLITYSEPNIHLEELKAQILKLSPIFHWDSLDGLEARAYCKKILLSIQGFLIFCNSKAVNYKELKMLESDFRSLFNDLEDFQPSSKMICELWDIAIPVYDLCQVEEVCNPIPFEFSYEIKLHAIALSFLINEILFNEY